MTSTKAGAATLLVLMACISREPSTLLAQSAFNPIRKLTTWYTDRNPIDIEVIGSTSRDPRQHVLQPNRALRFRLERAYVTDLVTRAEPGYEIVTFGVDMPTGLPNSIVKARHFGNEKAPDQPLKPPAISWVDGLKNYLAIQIQSEISDQTLVRRSHALQQCAGRALENGLTSYEWVGRPRCYAPGNPGGAKFIAQTDSSLKLLVECQKEDFRGIGCKLKFPFEGFGVEITFHREHLSEWGTMVAYAAKFLESKKHH
jgi:hypothetical protein